MKKILSLVLALAIVFTFSAVPVYAITPDVTLTITPNVTSVDTTSGDQTVVYTIALSNPGAKEVGSFSFNLAPPTGMTLATTSSRTQGAEGSYWINRDALSYDEFDRPTAIYDNFGYTPASKYLAATGAPATRILTVTNMTVMTISATIAQGTTGNLSLTATGFVAAEGASGNAGTNLNVEVTPTAVEAYNTISGAQAVTELAAPAKNGAPDVAVVAPTHTTATVAWFTDGGATAFGGAKFEGNTAYTAKVTLTPDTGYKFASGATFTLNEDAVTAADGEASGTKVLTKTFPATAAKELSSIAVTTSPTDMNYTHGETLDTTGMVVTGTYDDNTTGTVTAAVSYSDGGQYLKYNENSVEITSGGKKTTLGGLTVEQKALTITGLTATDRQYEANDKNVTLTGGILNGIVGNEDVSVDMPTSGTIKSDAVGNEKPVTVTKPGLTGAKAGNYTLSDITGVKVNITAATIPDAVKNVITGYGGTYDGGAHDAVVKGDDATDYTLKYSDAQNGTYEATCPTVKNVSDNKTVWVEISRDNYETVKKSVTTEITAKAVTVNVNADSKTYGYGNPTFSGTPDASTPMAASETVDILGITYQCDADTSSNVGKYNVTGSGTNTNYDITVSGTNVLTINPAPYDVTISGTQTIKFGSVLSAITVDDNIKGVGVNGEQVNGTVSWFTTDERTAEATDLAFNGLIVGTKKILYWKFEKTAGQDNYNADEHKGSTEFTIVEGDPQTLTFTGVTADAVTKTYGDEKFTFKATNDRTNGGTITYSSGTPAVATVNVNSGEVTILKQGTTVITATAAAVPGTYAVGAKRYTLTVSKKDVTVTAGDYKVSREYDKAITAGTPSGSLVPSGILGADSGVTVKVDTIGTYASADAGLSTVTLNLSLNGNDNENYNLVTTSLSVPAEITAKSITPTIEVEDAGKFDGTEKRPTITVKDNTDIIVAGYSFWYDDNINAGTNTAKVFVEAAPNGNYTWTGAVEKTFSIAKADAPTLTPSVPKYTVGATGEKTASISGVPANAGTTAYAVGTETDANNIITDGSISIDAATGIVTFTLSGTGADGNTAVIPVTVTMQNYEQKIENITVTLTAKDIPTANAEDITKTYDGVALTAAAIKGTASVEGTWSFKGTPGLTNVVDSGTKAVVFTPTETTYDTVEDIITVTINQATPTGAPKFTAITATGKTLADAALVKTVTGTTEGFSVAGEVYWDDDEMMTAVEANKAYGWTFVPTDSANYKSITGTAVVWTQSTGGIGGGAVIITPPAQDTVVTTDQKAEVTGSTAAVTPNLDSAIKEAGDKKASEIDINVKNTGFAKEIEVTLPKTTLQNIISKTNADLVIQTPAGNVTLDRQTMGAITSQAAGGEIIIKIKNVENKGEALNSKIGGSAKVIDVKIISNGENIKQFNGHRINLSIQLDKALTGKKLTGIRITDGNFIEKLGGAVVKKGSLNFFVFGTDRLSEYAVAEEAIVDQAIAAQEIAQTAKVIEGVKATKIMYPNATSPSKNKVKITWKKSKGYKVDGYQIYRSLKKTSGFKKVFTTPNKYCTLSKNLKSGKTYYFKIRGYRVIDGANVYTKWSRVDAARIK